MFSTRRTLRIEWGDCDPAGIVFYPRYFAMFDHSTVLLIEQALGMRKHKLYKHHGLGGLPAVETQARFLLPTRYGDDVEIESAITKVGRSSFASSTGSRSNGALAVEGNETRCWVVRDPTAGPAACGAADAGRRGRAASTLLRLDAEPLDDCGQLGALFLDRLCEFRGRAGADELPGRDEPRRDRGIRHHLLDVGGDAVANARSACRAAQTTR